jgi:hypothetical protein
LIENEANSTTKLFKFYTEQENELLKITDEG